MNCKVKKLLSILLLFILTSCNKNKTTMQPPQDQENPEVLEEKSSLEKNKDKGIEEKKDEQKTTNETDTPDLSSKETDNPLRELPSTKASHSEETVYHKPILLRLEALNAEKTYYTLDGTDPTTNGLLYEKPIHLEEPTVVTFYSKNSKGSEQIKRIQIQIDYIRQSLLLNSIL